MKDEALQEFMLTGPMNLFVGVKGSHLVTQQVTWTQLDLHFTGVDHTKTAYSKDHVLTLVRLDLWAGLLCRRTSRGRDTLVWEIMFSGTACADC